MHDERDACNKGFYDLIEACSHPSGGGIGSTPDNLIALASYRDRHKNVRMATGIQKALRILHESIEAAVASAYQRGMDRGRDFVAGLCDGSVSLAELNEAVATSARLPH